MSREWASFQEEAASFFRALGLDAQTNVVVPGVRTQHAIDVLVTSKHVGFEITWIVECKLWQSPVSKLHILALRQIVSDVGSDRGILLAEAGFQSGALEAANLTNVQLTSLASLRTSASTEILSMRFRDLYDRIESCRERYWDIPKSERIEHGLRFDVGAPTGYSGARALDLATSLLLRALRGAYPIDCAMEARMLSDDFPHRLDSAEQLWEVVEPLVRDLETRLNEYAERAKRSGVAPQ